MFGVCFIVFDGFFNALVFFSFCYIFQMCFCIFDVVFCHMSTNYWSQLPIVGSSSSFRPFGTSSSAMHRLRKSLCDLYLTALSLSRFSFSAICSLFLSDDPSCCEQFVVSLSSSPISVDVEVCSTSIVGVSSSRFLLDGILLFPSSPLHLYSLLKFV